MRWFIVAINLLIGIRALMQLRRARKELENQDK